VARPNENRALDVTFFYSLPLQRRMAYPARSTSPVSIISSTTGSGKPPKRLMCGGGTEGGEGNVAQQGFGLSPATPIALYGHVWHNPLASSVGAPLVPE
jgi:hypothetical protein